MIVVDMAGRPANAEITLGGRPALTAIVGLREADLKPVRFSPYTLVDIPISALSMLIHIPLEGLQCLANRLCSSLTESLLRSRRTYTNCAEWRI